MKGYYNIIVCDNRESFEKLKPTLLELNLTWADRKKVGESEDKISEESLDRFYDNHIIFKDESIIIYDNCIDYAFTSEYKTGYPYIVYSVEGFVNEQNLTGEQAEFNGWVAKTRDTGHVTLFKWHCPHRNKEKGTWEKYDEEEESMSVGFGFFPHLSYNDAPKKVRVTITILDE